MAMTRSGTNVRANGHRHGEWGKVAGFTKSQTTYYHLPMIKKPTWRWFIPLYFFLGGVAGGAAVIGAAAELLGGVKHRPTVRHARYLSFILAPISAFLLIADLGRPSRFHHMLRVFKVTSPLNVGTYILTLFGITSGALAVRQAVDDDLLPRDSLPGRMARLVPVKPATVAHGILGLGMGGYTGLVIAATAVPLWFAGGELLGPFFLATAIASGAAALRLIGGLTNTLTTEASEDIEDVEHVASLAQIGLTAARGLLVPREVKRPLQRGVWGWMWMVGGIGAGMFGPLVLGTLGRLATPRTRSMFTIVSGTLGVIGAFCERFALVEAGKVSAMDPVAYQRMTAGAPGIARPTAEAQAKMAPPKAKEHPFQAHQVVPEVY
jgi:formate-dependent nitrite reductase membrane component NrfD